LSAKRLAVLVISDRSSLVTDTGYSISKQLSVVLVPVRDATFTPNAAKNTNRQISGTFFLISSFGLRSPKRKIPIDSNLMRFKSALAALIVLLSVAVWFYGRDASPQPAAQSLAIHHNLLADLGIEPSQERTPAPGFLLNDSDGNVVRLDDLRGKVVLLNFWATWCPPCRLEMPSLEALQRQLGPRGLAVLAVASRDNARDVRSFIDEHRLSFPALLDPGAHAYGVYEIWSLPTSFVIDKRGYLVGKVVGHRDWSSEQSKDFFLHLLGGSTYIS
jgi:peroxiredoxin